MFVFVVVYVCVYALTNLTPPSHLHNTAHTGFACSKEEALTVMGLKPDLKNQQEFRWLYDLGASFNANPT